MLENKFLFGYNNEPKKPNLSSLPNHNQFSPHDMKSSKRNGKVRILYIDGSGATNGILAAKSLTHLKSYPRSKSEKPNAHIANYFDVVVRSSICEILAALLFTRGRDGFLLFSTQGAFRFLVENCWRIFLSLKSGICREFFGSQGIFWCSLSNTSNIVSQQV